MTLICVPIVEANVEDAKKAILKAKELGADLVELRLDYLGKLDDGKIGDVVDYLDIPKIATIRSKAENGFWNGEEKDRINHLITCLSFGAQYIDIEGSTDIGWRYELAKACKNNKAQMIISHHDFKKTPGKQEMIDICKNEFAGGAAIAKISVTPQKIEDVMNVMAVVEHLKAANKQIIGVSMGKIGRITRILGPQVGSYLTYASLERGKESADGQLTIAETKTIWEILQG